MMKVWLSIRNVRLILAVLCCQIWFVASGVACPPVSVDVTPVGQWYCEIHFSTNYCGFTKEESKRINWPGKLEVKDVAGHGVRGYEYSGCVRGIKPCWPHFMPAIIDTVNSTWSQEV